VIQKSIKRKPLIPESAIVADFVKSVYDKKGFSSSLLLSSLELSHTQSVSLKCKPSPEHFCEVVVLKLITVPQSAIVADFIESVMLYYYQ